ncbi:hypothetical protein [Alcanivorax sp. 1008]|uniref:hypothetical protein n=1 Tax=Alcanivorax sp. 1008 TaxID=2816853 RepID=UPI001E0F8C3C|nr:hypothetical protein [Alcanivorax sp. 1008]MCC1495875.1 hypothetical protein [Alcanivorax sp. 1008]
MNVNTASIGQLKALYACLALPEPGMCEGFFRARFLGPAWMRASARPTLNLSGLPGWQGKRFTTATSATNVLIHKGQTEERLTMTVTSVKSLVDGSDGLALCYGPDAPRPWRWVRDELRAIDANTLLGITFVDKPLIRLFAFPFLLERAS